VTVPLRIEMQGGEVTSDNAFCGSIREMGMKNPSNFILRVSDKIQLEIHARGLAHPATS